MQPTVQYKDFSNSKIISVDTETYDPDLKDLGPGDLRDNTFVLGYSLADETGFNEYYNVGHYDCRPEERAKNLDHLARTMALPVPKLGANIIYDIGYIQNKLSIPVVGQLYDIQIAESLLNENKLHIDLDTLALEYLKKGKHKTDIERFCEEHNLKGDPRQWLFKMQYQLVRKYGIVDAAEPVEIFRIQWRELYNQDLLDLLHLECDLIRPLLEMRKNGTRIDTVARDRNIQETQVYLNERDTWIKKNYGGLNVNSTQQMAAMLSDMGIQCPVTGKGNPSVTNDFLKSIQEQTTLAQYAIELKKGKKMLNDFLLGSMTKFLDKDNLIHCSFYNTKLETGDGMAGTRSGRFSSAKPNLQQIPKRNKYWYKVCRENFIPFDGCWWGKIDYSQIEYRFMAHFAIGPGSEAVRKSYNDNPYIDYHQYIMDITGLDRDLAKNMNFGCAYGMGAKKMAKKFGWTLQHCYDMLKTYHSGAPFIKTTMSGVEQAAIRNGYIKTFLGRRSRLIDINKAYTMFCRLTQGSAADMMKRAMMDIYNAGLFNAMFFHITVHDELDMSIPQTLAGLEAFEETKHIMETCIDLRVPIIADAEIGRNWYDIEDYNKEKYRGLIA